MPHDDVYVTGLGVFTYAGFGTDALTTSVFAGRHGFGPVGRFDGSRFRCRVAAEFDGTGPGAPGVDHHPHDVPAQADVLAACGRAALEDAGLDPARVAGALVGSQGDFRPVTSFSRARAGVEDPHPSRLRDSHPGRISHAVADALGVGGLRMTFTNACVASSDAIVHGSRMIASGRAAAVLCGGVYLVEEELFAKFDSARSMATDDDRVRPFSQGRPGLLLGDGAGLVLLESGTSVRERGGEARVRIAGWGNSSDAYHVSRPHPQGAGTARAMAGALGGAGFTPDSVDYINVHGTGTPSNDPAETAALHTVLGEVALGVPASSTKSATGHTLEGAGVVEAIITMLAMDRGQAPPTANFQAPDPACDLDYVVDGPRRLDIRRAVSLNSAFGGVNTALALEAA